MLLTPTEIASLPDAEVEQAILNAVLEEIGITYVRENPADFDVAGRPD